MQQQKKKQQINKYEIMLDKAPGLARNPHLVHLANKKSALSRNFQFSAGPGPDYIAPI